MTVDPLHTELVAVCAERAKLQKLLDASEAQCRVYQSERDRAVSQLLVARTELATVRGELEVAMERLRLAWGDFEGSET